MQNSDNTNDHGNVECNLNNKNEVVKQALMSIEDFSSSDINAEHPEKASSKEEESKGRRKRNTLKNPTTISMLAQKEKAEKRKVADDECERAAKVRKVKSHELFFGIKEIHF